MKKIIEFLFGFLFTISGFLFPILGIISTTNDIIWLYILSVIYSCYYIFINLSDGRFINLISAYIINLLILYIGNYSILDKYNIFVISLIELPAVDYFYVIINILISKKNKNSNNEDNDSEDIIKTLMVKSNLSFEVCSEIVTILNYFVCNDLDNAYYHIENNLTQILYAENNIGQVGIALGMLIDEKALSKEQSMYYSQKIMTEILNNQTKDK